MKSISTLQQAQAVINDILNRLDTLTVKNWDRHQTRIVNAHPSVDEYDYVVRKELDAIRGGDVVQQLTGNFTDKCTFGLGIHSFVAVGTDVCPPYVCAGNLSAKFTIAAIKVAPTEQSIKVQLRKRGSLDYIFSTPLEIPADTTSVIEKTDFAISTFNYKDVILCDVLQVGNGQPGTDLVIVTVFE